MKLLLCSVRSKCLFHVLCFTGNSVLLYGISFASALDMLLPNLALRFYAAIGVSLLAFCLQGLNSLPFASELLGDLYEHIIYLNIEQPVLSPLSSLV